MVFYKVEIFQIKDDNAMRDKKPRRCGRSVQDLSESATSFFSMGIAPASCVPGRGVQ
jgi:hypothetical protein